MSLQSADQGAAWFLNPHSFSPQGLKSSSESYNTLPSQEVWFWLPIQNCEPGYYFSQTDHLARCCPQSETECCQKTGNTVATSICQTGSPSVLIWSDIPGLWEFCCKEGEPLSGPKGGLLSNTQKWMVWGDTCADKARDFFGILLGMRTQWRAEGQVKLGGLFCHVAHNLGFYGDEISF